MENLQSFVQVYWKINWLRRTAITLLCFLLFLLMLPLAIQYGAAHQLKKMGASQAEIDDIDLNLFAGSFELQKLKVTSGKNEQAHIDKIAVDINMLELISSRIVIDTFQINGVKVHVLRRKNGEISINGLVIPQNETRANKEAVADESSPAAFAINKLNIQDVEFTYQETDFTQNGTIQSLGLNNIRSWQRESTAKLDARILLNTAALNITADLNLFKQVPEFKGKVSLVALSLSSYAKFYRDHLEQLEASLSLDKNFEIKLTDPVNAELSGSIEIAGLELGYQHIKQSTEKIAWQGQTSLMQDGKLSVSGDLDISKSHTSDQQQQYQIAALERLNLSGLKMLDSSISFERLQLDNTALIDIRDETEGSSNPFVELSKLELQRLSMNTESSILNIEQVNLDNPRVTLSLNSEKQIDHLLPLFKTLDGFSPTGDSKPEQTAESASDKPAFSIDINQVKLLKPGLLKITDNSVSPTFKSIIHLNQIDVNKVSSQNPANFVLALKQGDYTDIQLKGDGLLFNPTEQLKLEASIKQLDLPPVTPYSSDAMGYGMKSGVIDSDIKLELKQREIDSLIDLKIDSIEVVETNKKTAEQISSASGMSIDLAVSSLKDSNNVIELKLPVKGNIDQPDFDLSLIINQAMGKAMKSATLSYLKHSLQPFGSLITLFSLAKAAADHISLPPILFKINSVEFQDQQDDLINKISGVLKDRPGLKIKACGVSAVEDQAAIKLALIEEEKARLKQAQAKLSKEQLAKAKQQPEEIVISEKLIQEKMKELADNRAARVKAFFLEKGGLDSNRILNCLSSTNPNEDSKPSVEMQI